MKVQALEKYFNVFQFEFGLLSVNSLQFPSSGIMQPGAHYMQQHQQAQQMTPQALMAACSSMLQYAQTAVLSASTTASFTQPARHELRWKHMTSYDAK